LKGRAPCGHPGTAVTPNFYTCDLRCEFESDGVPVETDREVTVPLCRHCGSDEVSKWGPEFNVNGNPLWQCRARGCGKSFHD
jgi:hypothetical protein